LMPRLLPSRLEGTGPNAMAEAEFMSTNVKAAGNQQAGEE